MYMKLFMLWPIYNVANTHAYTNPLISLEIGNKVRLVLKKFTRSTIDFQVKKKPTTEVFIAIDIEQ